MSKNYEDMTTEERSRWWEDVAADRFLTTDQKPLVEFLYQLVRDVYAAGVQDGKDSK